MLLFPQESASTSRWWKCNASVCFGQETLFFRRGNPPSLPPSALCELLPVLLVCVAVASKRNDIFRCHHKQEYDMVLKA